jgi:adenosylcobinamide kinase/adenosylcobinamide-phosphate guanylyltransferase
MTTPKALFVLGGARSGKSRYAQARAEASACQLIFIATAQAFDAEMTDRIVQHRADRGERWSTVEAPLDLAGAIAAHDATDTILLIDCLTLWASNLMFEERDIAHETQKLVEAIVAARSQIILVANEVGLGIVPDNALARRFRDVAGSINQAVAAAADEAVMMFVGLPLWLKKSD